MVVIQKLSIALLMLASGVSANPDCEMFFGEDMDFRRLRGARRELFPGLNMPPMCQVLHSENYEYCPKANLCDTDKDKEKYHMYRKKKDGKCEKKCIDYNKVEKAKEDGFSCQDCDDQKLVGQAVCTYASSSCANEDHVCDVIEGQKRWSVHKDVDTACETKCVSSGELDFLKSMGFKCGPCPSCSHDNICEDKDGKVKYSLYRVKKDGKCEVKCEDAKNAEKKKQDGFKCGTSCPAPVGVSTDSITSVLPTPEKCVLKRSKELLMYEPDFPAGRPDVYIEVEISNGDRFQFYPTDYPSYSGGVIPMVNSTVFQILFNEQTKLGGNGFKLRYVSKNGEGGWNTCSYSPIALDINHSGSVEIIEGEFEIDITGDGDLEELQQWFAPTEGILIDAKAKEGKDDYQDGIISGHHLLGDMGGQYADGFAKLSGYDDNGDGMISGKEFKGLYIWVDANSNLRLDEGELKTFDDYNIVGLSTSHNNYKSHAMLADGTTMLVQDIWFKR